MEDRFDGANRRNLRRFIVAGEKGEVTIPRENRHEITSEHDEFEESVSVQERYYYYAHDKIANDSAQEEAEDRRELVRIPTCAVFHKFAAGRGVPHSFIGFVRQWPALPQVVVSLLWSLLSLANFLPIHSRKIFMSVCVLPIPRVPTEQRYDVNKVRSVKGLWSDFLRATRSL